jgi:hypothetical protein
MYSFVRIKKSTMKLLIELKKRSGMPFINLIEKAIILLEKNIKE